MVQDAKHAGVRKRKPASKRKGSILEVRYNQIALQRKLIFWRRVAAGLQSLGGPNAAQLSYSTAQPTSSDPFRQSSSLLGVPSGPGPLGRTGLSMGGVPSGPNPSIGATGLQPNSTLGQAGAAGGWSFLDDIGAPPTSATTSGRLGPPPGPSGNAGLSSTGGPGFNSLPGSSGILGGGLPGMGTAMGTAHGPLAKGPGTLGNAGLPGGGGGLSGQGTGGGVLDPFDFGSLQAPMGGGLGDGGQPGGSGSQFDPFDFGPMQNSAPSRIDSLI